MVYNSSCLDSTSNLLILLKREFDGLSSGIFKLILIFVITRNTSNSRIDKHAHMFSFSVEERAIIRFFTFKKLNPFDICTKLLSAYENNALVLWKVHKWHQCFADRKIELCDNPWSGQPLQGNLAEILGAMLRKCHFTSCKRLCVHFMIAMAMCLRILDKVLHLEKFNSC
jgi:hypothetical protein